MSVPIDPTAPPVIQRYGVPYASATVSGDEQQPAHRRLAHAGRRVEPVERSEKTRAADDGRLREERPEPARERSPADAEVEAPPPAAASGSYDRKLSYEADVNRVYLDIVNTKDDEVLLRLPSESTAKYLEQVTAQSDEKTDPASTPRFQEIA